MSDIPNVTPFWQRLPLFFRYPLHVEPLLYMLVLSFLAVPFSTAVYGVRLRGLLKGYSASPPPPVCRSSGL